MLLLADRLSNGAPSPPIFYDHPPGTPAVDPVVQALVLTDIVIGATDHGAAARVWPCNCTNCAKARLDPDQPAAACGNDSRRCPATAARGRTDGGCGRPAACSGASCPKHWPDAIADTNRRVGGACRGHLLRRWPCATEAAHGPLTLLVRGLGSRSDGLVTLGIALLRPISPRALDRHAGHRRLSSPSSDRSFPGATSTRMHGAFPRA